MTCPLSSLAQSYPFGGDPTRHANKDSPALAVYQSKDIIEYKIAPGPVR